jgi:hypothetical protein
MPRNIKIDGSSDVVREQIIHVIIAEQDIMNDVDTVRVAVRTSYGRTRSMVFSRDQLTTTDVSRKASGF